MKQLTIDPAHIARICHEANRAYCETQGDHSQPLWEHAPDWQRASAIDGVWHALEGGTPETLHENWLRAKLADGWVYGPIKDSETKQHPCLVPYDQLPEEQKRKDRLFVAIANVFMEDGNDVENDRS